jgi:hypothetical protein
MSEPKTQRTKASVAAFIAAIEDETRRKDAKAIDKLLREVSGDKPAMWGPSIIGYGQYAYTGASGRGDVWPRIGFSPRKSNFTLYLMLGLGENAALLQKLGTHKTGKGCLYINKLAEVDEKVLRTLIERSWKLMRAKYPS